MSQETWGDGEEGVTTPIPPRPHFASTVRPVTWGMLSG